MTVEFEYEISRFEAETARHGGRSRGQRGRHSPLGGAVVSGRAATPFASLTGAGQQRRLRTVAREALRAHRGRVAALHLHATAFNTVFRVDLVGGTRRALRVSPALRIHPRETEQLEAAWTDQISDQTSISVARVCPDRNGGVATEVEVPDVDGTRTCVLFEWVRGARLRDRADPDRMRQAGALLAELHEQAAARGDIAAPAGAMVANRVLHFEIDDRLAECHERYGHVVDDARHAAQEAIDALWADPPQRPHLLHGDFTWKNVLAGRDGLTVIDFQDVMFGFPAIDVVNAVCPLDRLKGSQPLGDALREGYCSVRPWPIEDPVLFGALIAARRVLQIDLGLQVRLPDLDEHIEHHVAKLRSWLDEGPDLEIQARFTR